MEIVHPTSVKEALAGLTEGVTPLAGGTDLMVEVNFGHSRPVQVVGLRRIAELKEWEGSRIGSGVTWRRIEQDGPKALAEAARTVGSPQIRNTGSWGWSRRWIWRGSGIWRWIWCGSWVWSGSWSRTWGHWWFSRHWRNLLLLLLGFCALYLLLLLLLFCTKLALLTYLK